METNHARLFERWYANPIKVLGSIPDGDGGFIALATGCFLYERYATALIKKAGKKADKKSKIQQLMLDFHLDAPAAQAFWDVIRDGMLHQGMPYQKEGLPPCRLSNFDVPIALQQTNLGLELQIQPWHFASVVIGLWQKNLPLLKESKSFPWAWIV